MKTGSGSAVRSIDLADRLNHLLNDVAFAFRQFGRQPRFYAVVALTLIVGIAASTSIFG